MTNSNFFQQFSRQSNFTEDNNLMRLYKKMFSVCQKQLKGSAYMKTFSQSPFNLVPDPFF